MAAAVLIVSIVTVQSIKTQPPMI